MFRASKQQKTGIANTKIVLATSLIQRSTVLATSLIQRWIVKAKIEKIKFVIIFPKDPMMGRIKF